MTTFITFVTIISIIVFTITKAQSINITRGSSLTPTGATTSWSSPSGLYAFGFYPQTRGYAVGIYITKFSQRIVVWTANRDALPLSDDSTLRFTSDGRLTVDDTQGRQISLFGTGGASFATMQNNGNFVLYDSTGLTVLWQSFDYPTDTLLAGQRLVSGGKLFSSVSELDQTVGLFQLIMQLDGNLVLYPNMVANNNTAYWDSKTFHNGPKVTLNLDSTGFLYLLQNSTFFIKNFTERGNSLNDAIYRLKLDADGILRLYYHDLRNTNNTGSVKWESLTNKCAPKGLCGLNGYCVVINDAASCQCIPGFEAVDEKRWGSGCQRTNDTVESCKISDADKTAIRMENLYNVRLDEATYVIPKASTQAACSSACLNDYNCEAALFTGQECRLQRLPLRYLEVNENMSSVVLIKVCSPFVRNESNDSIHVKKVRENRIMVIGLIVSKQVPILPALVIGVSLISFAVLVLLICGVIMYRTQVWAYKKISDNLSAQLFEGIGPVAFSYAALEKITDGFKEELGSGTFGIVYKGLIEGSMRPVAVKKLKEELAQEGEREFQTEMKVIGRTHHRNLTKLLGYCCEGSKRLLVFEYMTQGSLADVLYEPKERMPKPCWLERVRMAVDVANGILYLHEGCENPIIHCDIKPQNILMDEHGNAKISDFGLAKLLEHDQSKTSTLLRGTRGYIAPEWHKKVPVTVKVDVYSFGIVLFNILCCRRHVDNNLPESEVILEDWVFDCYEADQVLKLVDYDEDVDKRRLEEMVKIGLWCVQEEPSLRPSMKRVVLMLEGSVKIPLPPNPTSFVSVV